METMSAQKSIDERLVELLARDLRLSFESLIFTYERPLTLFVLAYMKNSSLAEDVVQETFIRAYRALSGYSQDRMESLQLRPWIFTIARNTAINQMIQLQREKETLSSLDEPKTIEQAENIADNQALSAERVVEHTEYLADLRGYIMRLPIAPRRVVQLHYILDFSYREIAEMLSIPLNTVKSHGRRGLNMLRGMMAQEEGNVFSETS